MVRVSRFWSIDKVIPGLARLLPCKTFLRLLDTETQLYIDIFTCIESVAGQLEILPLSDMHRPRDVNGQIFRIPKEAVFPLQQLVFEGREYPAPNRTEAYLKHYYGEDLAPDHAWDMQLGRYVQRRAVSGSSVLH